MAEKFPKLVGAHILLIRDGNIFLIRRTRGDWKGHYALPAGHVDEKEPVTAAAIREAKEEVGVDIEVADLQFVHVINRVREHSGKETIEFFFTAKKWSGEPTNCEPEKCDDAQWFPLTALPKNLLPYTRHALECIQQNVSFSEYGW